MKNLVFLGVVLVLGIGVLLGLFPKFMTGDYVQVTIVSIEIDEGGGAKLVWKGTQSSGTRHCSWYSVNGVRQRGGGGSSGGFPPWPVPCSGTDLFPLDPGRQDAVPKLDRATLRGRIKVAEGETYVVRPGEPLIFYQFQDADGIVHEGGIEIP